jgi:hypothetical protein
MADVLALVASGLPVTFPPEAVPEAGALFVAARWPGMTQGSDASARASGVRGRVGSLCRKLSRMRASKSTDQHRPSMPPASRGRSNGGPPAH